MTPTYLLALDDAVPGKSMAGVRLGMARSAACKVILDRNKYGAKWAHSGDYRFQSGLTEDVLKLNEGSIPLLKIAILSRNGAVVQISRTSGNDLPQTDYSFSKLEQKHSLQESSFDFEWPSDGGVEGYYFDDVGRGVCFVGHSQDVFFLREKPDTLIVHRSGTAVIPIMEGAVGKRDHGAGGRVYANEADYSRQEKHQKNDY